jgi:ATP-dependent phosphofructokinase / diphosphate-dependent phosphofructokinase
MKIAINTGGGDAPGLNAVIRAATASSIRRGWTIHGIRDGFMGLLEPSHYSEKKPPIFELTRPVVRGITHLGGTILGTTNRGNPLEYPTVHADESVTTEDRCPELVDKLRELGFDGMIVIGGEGTMAIAQRIGSLGFPVVGVPKTIDNDLTHTVATFGFDTAVAFATEAIDRLHSTAQSHGRTMIIEVMGRYAGWIALHAGMAGTADVILLPEIPYSMEAVVAKIQERYTNGMGFAIVVVAEGAKEIDGDHRIVGQSIGQAVRLGGAGQYVADEISRRTGVETRCTVLGHLQRGGSPTSYDRLLSVRFGSAAVRTLASGVSNVMIVLDPPEVRYVPLDAVLGHLKTVPLDCDTIDTARDLGICLGDQS